MYFRCRVTGPDRASVTVTWTVNGTFVGFPPPPYKMSWSQGGVLMIRPLFVGRTDGLYECVAKDKKGTAIRKGFRLTVKAGNANIAVVIFLLFAHCPFGI